MIGELDLLPEDFSNLPLKERWRKYNEDTLMEVTVATDRATMERGDPTELRKLMEYKAKASKVVDEAPDPYANLPKFVVNINATASGATSVSMVEDRTMPKATILGMDPLDATDVEDSSALPPIRLDYTPQAQADHLPVVNELQALIDSMPDLNDDV